MNETIQSIDRAFSILMQLGEHPQGMQVSELATVLKLNKGTVSRILYTLFVWGVVEKQNNKSYRLGMRLVDLSSCYLNSLQLKTEALPFLEKLQNQTGLIVHLGIMQDAEVVYLDKISSFQNIRMYSQIGKRAYPHSTGLGKAMLSAMDQTTVDWIINKNGLIAITDKTIVDREMFFKQLSVGKQCGYVIDDEENEAGIRCVAAPIFDYTGRAIASVSATGFTSSFLMEQIESVALFVTECTGSISRCMGYHK